MCSAYFKYNHVIYHTIEFSISNSYIYNKSLYPCIVLSDIVSLD